jgi:methylated-DNA-[protein]-cysteine S-methyltransferase
MMVAASPLANRADHAAIIPKHSKHRYRDEAMAENATYCTRYQSPVGELILAGDEGRLEALLLPEHHGAPPVVPTDWIPQADVFKEAAAQLDAYFAGELTEFDLPLAPSGTPFQMRVWNELLAIPYGVTATYGQIAARIGQPTAMRAVGLANGRNPLAIVIPCHRVIGAGGSLTGYGGGLDRKRWLLDLEARTINAAATPGR